MKFRVKVDVEKLKRLSNEISPQNPTFHQAVFSGFEDWYIRELDPLIQENLAGKVLKRRTGHLAQSVRFRPGKIKTAKTTTFNFGVYSRHYGYVHEHGAVIRPKRARFLAIPMEAARTRAGVMRRPPREWPDTFVKRTKKGNLIIFQHRRSTKGHSIVPLFLLKKQVTIPPRPWAKPAISKAKRHLLGYIYERLEGMLR